MSTSNSVRTQAAGASAGDAAVAGLLRGLTAGLAMAAFLVAAGLLSGQGPADTLAAFTLSGQALASNALTGLLGHLAVAGVYGLIWGLAWRVIGGRMAIPAWLGGLVYGLLLWGVSQLLVRSVGSSLALIAPWALLA
ncbi:MAG TPA: hypothetical protein VL334_18395, partial [Anaerolineae bacterium]|nr:hypothetical protein [Anaerolineae bacterium]